MTHPALTLIIWCVVCASLGFLIVQIVVGVLR